MTIAGKRDDLTRADLRRVASQFGVRDADDVIDDVVAVVGDWKRYATDAGVAGAYRDQISATHRLL
jgi:hypothetical protein